jgi:3'(2'), 5'-bisphosphate nucleotidase
MEHPLSEDLRCAIRSARAGGDAAMKHYGAVSVFVKDSGSPVTAADHASTDAIIAAISAAFPDDSILCEETVDDFARLRARRVWIVDPLDGTKEFISRNGEFSVMVGLVEHGRPTAGAVYVPASGQMYFAERTRGAWVDEGGALRPLLRNRATQMRAVVSRSHTDTAVESICTRVEVTARKPSGSVGIKCALIAADEADIYAHPVPFMGEWDTCAPEIILTEAGGSVTDCHGRRLEYNKCDTRQAFGILACAPGVLDLVLPVVSAVFAAAHP